MNYIKGKKIICVIPAFNEETNIGRTINDVKKYVDQVVVVDDGSSDNTFKKAKAEQVIVIRHCLNRGQGAALQTGNVYALKQEAQIIIHFDADGQFIGQEINDLTKPILEGKAEAVIGSRFLGKKSGMPWIKERIIMPIGRLVNKILLNVSLTDPQGGFRALSRKAVSMIEIENDGAAHCSEILYKLTKLGISVMEVPVTVKYNSFGQTIIGGKGRGTGGVRIVIDLIIAKLIR